MSEKKEVKSKKDLIADCMALANQFSKKLNEAEDAGISIEIEELGDTWETTDGMKGRYHNIRVYGLDKDMMERAKLTDYGQCSF